jgi:hypothetical protein
MTIEQMGSLGELIAAIATIATLLYLSIQIRANTNATRVESRRTTQRQANEYSALIANSAEAASLFRRGLADMESLDADEHIRFIFLFGMLVSQTQSAYEDADLGILDRDLFEATATPAFTMLQTPGGRRWWDLYGRSMYPAFQERVEDLLDSPQENPA